MKPFHCLFQGTTVFTSGGILMTASVKEVTAETVTGNGTD
jgi:hypothetical protein